MQDYSKELKSFKLFCNKNFNFDIVFNDQDIIELFQVMTLLEIMSTYDEKLPNGFTYFSSLAHSMAAKLLYSLSVKEPLFTDMCERQIAEYLFKIIYLLTIDNKISIKKLSRISYRNFWDNIKTNLKSQDGNIELKNNESLIMKLNVIYSNNSKIIHSKKQNNEIDSILSDIIKHDSTIDIRNNVKTFHKILIVIFKLANIDSDLMTMYQRRIYKMYTSSKP